MEKIIAAVDKMKPFFEKVSKRVITLKYKIKYDSDNNIPFFENII